MSAFLSMTTNRSPSGVPNGSVVTVVVVGGRVVVGACVVVVGAVVVAACEVVVAFVVVVVATVAVVVEELDGGSTWVTGTVVSSGIAPGSACSLPSNASTNTWPEVDLEGPWASATPRRRRPAPTT